MPISGEPIVNCAKNPPMRAELRIVPYIRVLSFFALFLWLRTHLVISMAAIVHATISRINDKKCNCIKKSIPPNFIGAVSNWSANPSKYYKLSQDYL